MRVPANRLEGPLKRAAISTACFVGDPFYTSFNDMGEREPCLEHRGPSRLNSFALPIVSVLSGDVGLEKQKSSLGC